jgi:hypothetical protein
LKAEHETAAARSIVEAATEIDARKTREKRRRIVSPPVRRAAPDRRRPS